MLAFVSLILGLIVGWVLGAGYVYQAVADIIDSSDSPAEMAIKITGIVKQFDELNVEPLDKESLDALFQTKG